MSVEQVIFLLMRHGLYKGQGDQEKLTPEGRRMVEIAAKELVRPLGPVHLLLASDSPRAIETAQVTADKINCPCGGQVILDQAFGVTWTEADGIEGLYPWETVKNAIQSAKSSSQPLSVRDLWMKDIYPAALTFRHMLLTAMRHWAVRVALEPLSLLQSTVTILVGCHGSNTYAFLKPEEADPNPPNCSVAVYKWQLLPGQPPNLVSSELLVPSFAK